MDLHAIRRLGRAAPALASLLLATCADLRVPLGPGSVSPTVAVWVTTPDRLQLLARQPDLPLALSPPTAPLVVDVDHHTRYQQMVGFGAALTGSSARLVHRGLSAVEREVLLHRMFDPVDGAGFSFLRLPMGATDFSHRSFSYHDLPPGVDDPDLSRFSIAPDREDVLPVLRRAREINPELALVASPWSAPAWMKTSGSLHGGRLRPDAYDAYARYFQKFIEAYGEEGIPIYAVTMVNEPHHEAPYPSMRMEVADGQRFAGEFLGPRLEAAGIRTRILGWDHNWQEVEAPLEILRDARAARYIAGTAFHCYGGDASAQSRVKEEFPAHDIFFTECTGGQWATDFGSNLRWKVRNLVIGATRNWSRSVLLWNLALDPQGGPQNGGCSDCRGVVTVDPSAGTVQYNEEFYSLAHASKFVRPGAHRIESSAAVGPIQTVAFQNPDGSKVLIALNESGERESFAIRWGGRTAPFEMPAGSVATFVWP